MKKNQKKQSKPAIIKIVVKRLNGSVSTWTQNFYAPTTEVGEIENLIDDVIWKKKWGMGVIQSITITEFVPSKKVTKIDAMLYQHLLVKDYEKEQSEEKRHETVLSKRDLDKYEAQCRIEGVSARFQTQKLITDYLHRSTNDDGLIEGIDNWRNLRLIKFFGELEKLSNGIMCFIFKVIDHEGSLSVYWTEPPSLHDMVIVEKAWEAVGETEVEAHYDYLEKRPEWDMYRQKRSSMISQQITLPTAEEIAKLNIENIKRKEDEKGKL